MRCWLLLLFGFTGLLDAQEIPWQYPAAPRIIALGDLHGDLQQTLKALKIGGLIDDQNRWIGGNTVLVQTGDQLDRGDDEDAILLLFEDLVAQAAAAGGAVHVLNGNHELMNAYFDFRYVTEGGFTDFAATPEALKDPEFQSLHENQRGRAAAFRPGGPYALILAKRNTILKIGDTVFVHGGVLPDSFGADPGAYNAAIRAWLRGERERPEGVKGKDVPVWTRRFSDGAADCELLTQSLKALGAQRMVVGHTVQEAGITSDCQGRVWRIDIGLAAHYGGKPAVLEITEGQVKALTLEP